MDDEELDESTLDQTIEDDLRKRQADNSGPIRREIENEIKGKVANETYKARKKIRMTMGRPVGITAFSTFFSAIAVIIAMIGIVAFITSMPGMVQEQILNKLLGGIDNLGYIVNGSDYYLDELASDPDKTIKYLQGVTFQLQEKSHENDSEWIDVPVTKGDGNYYRPIDTTKKTPEKAETITTDDNGQILIRGLDGDKNYQLLEINPAPGYNSMDEPAQLTLSLEDYSSTSVSIDQGNETNITYLSLKSIAKISNKPGTVLPSTGGIGTTILYATGAILVLGAGILLVTRRRMSVN